MLHNLSSDEASVPIGEDEGWEKVVFSSRESMKIEDGSLTLPAYTTVVVK